MLVFWRVLVRGICRLYFKCFIQNGGNRVIFQPITSLRKITLRLNVKPLNWWVNDDIGSISPRIRLYVPVESGISTKKTYDLANGDVETPINPIRSGVAFLGIHPGRLTAGFHVFMEVDWFRSFSFLWKWVIFRWTMLIFQGVQYVFFSRLNTMEVLLFRNLPWQIPMGRFLVLIDLLIYLY